MAARARHPPARARVSRRRPDGARGSRGRAVSRRVARADVQGAQFPRALHHQAGNVAHGGDAHDRPRAARPQGRPRRPARRHPHRTGVPGGRDRGRELRRRLDRSRSARQLRTDRRADPAARRQVSRSVPRRADVPQREDRRGPHGIERSDRHPHLRQRPERPSRARGRRARDDLAHPGREPPVRRVPGRRGAGAGHGEPRAGTALRAQAGRRPPSGRHDDGKRGSRRHLPRRACLRRPRVDDSRGPSQHEQPAQPPARHARRRARGHARRGRHQDRARRRT